MQYLGRLMTLIAAAAILACGSAVYGAEKNGPKKETIKKATPKKEAGVERHVPYWNEVQGANGAAKNGAKGAAKAKGPMTVFDDFKETAASKDKKPFVIYFYWPAADTTDSSAKDCGTFETALMAAPECAKALKEFTCYKSDAKKLDKELKRKYAAKVPSMLVFDATGKQVRQVTSIPAREKSLAEQLGELKKKSDKALEKSKGDAKKGGAEAKKSGVDAKKGDAEAKKSGADAKKGDAEATKGKGDADEDQGDADEDQGDAKKGKGSKK